MIGPLTVFLILTALITSAKTHVSRVAIFRNGDRHLGFAALHDILYDSSLASEALPEI